MGFISVYFYKPLQIWAYSKTIRYGKRRRHRLLWLVPTAAALPSGQAVVKTLCSLMHPIPLFTSPSKHEIFNGKKISMKWLIVEALINYCSLVMLLSEAARWQDCAWGTAQAFFLFFNNTNVLHIILEGGIYCTNCTARCWGKGGTISVISARILLFERMIVIYSVSLSDHWQGDIWIKQTRLQANSSIFYILASDPNPSESRQAS